MAKNSSKKPQNWIYLSSRFFERACYKNAYNFYQEWYFFIILLAGGGFFILAIRADFFLGVQEIIIYRLVMINHDLEAFLKKNQFLAGKWVLPPRWLIGWNVWVNRYRREQFSKI